jgi:hypothetical protein
MKQKSQLVLGLVLFFSLLTLPPTPATTGTGIGFSYRDFWFYIHEPTTLDFPSMLFTVHNPSVEPVTVVCRQEAIAGLNISITFEWEEYQLAPKEMKTNHYAITINSTLAVTHTLKIVLFTRTTTGNQSSLAGAGVIHNKITYYTEETGALLTINVLDQSFRPRNSTIYINYKGDASTAWTPLRVINNSFYTGFFPTGEYQLQAYDSETGIYAEKIFTLTNESTVELILQLVAIKIGPLHSYHHLERLYIRFNLTISNYVEAFEYVEIRAAIYNLQAEVLDSVINPQLSLPKITNFKLLTEFKGLQLRAGKYRILAQIVTTNNLILAETYQDVHYTPPVHTSQVIQYGVIVIGAVVIIVWGTKPQWMNFLEGVRHKRSKQK